MLSGSTPRRGRKPVQKDQSNGQVASSSMTSSRMISREIISSDISLGSEIKNEVPSEAGSSLLTSQVAPPARLEGTPENRSQSSRLPGYGYLQPTFSSRRKADI